MIIDNLNASKGTTNAAGNDRFIFQAYTDFYNASTEDLIASTWAQDFGIEPDSDAELRKGSTVGVPIVEWQYAIIY
jgi:hypothetical protein